MNWNMGALNPSMSLENIGAWESPISRSRSRTLADREELSQAKILSMSTSCAAMRMSSRLSKCR